MKRWMSLLTIAIFVVAFATPVVAGSSGSGYGGCSPSIDLRRRWSRGRVARATVVVAPASTAPTRRSAARAAISPSRRLRALGPPPVRRRRAPTVARPGPAVRVPEVMERWVVQRRPEVPVEARVPAAQLEAQVLEVLAVPRAPAEQAGPVEQVVPRATATRSMVARPPGQVEQVELVRQAGVPPTRRAAYLVRMSVRLAPPPVVPAAVRPAVVRVRPGTARPLAVPGPAVVRVLQAG